ncbi:MAG: hypothetical protein LQ351_006025 [Letrouitia transgressa]|nr:MAG: hypothetical protein LQ351_006025 [Letrouitia transgressa]
MSVFVYTPKSSQNLTSCSSKATAKWTMSQSPAVPSLLNLPREIRDAIIGEVLFPAKKDQVDGSHNGSFINRPCGRNIFPYARRRKGKRVNSAIEVAVIRSCKQIQREAEELLYGSSTWILMHRDGWAEPMRHSYEFFEALPRRLRDLIQRVECRAFSSAHPKSISLFDWTLFMTFLSRECSKLHTLNLWGPEDPSEARSWVDQCNEDQAWVRAMLQIKSLKHFRLMVVNTTNVCNGAEYKEIFLPWLRDAMMGTQSTVESGEIIKQDNRQAFPFLKLGLNIRKQVYEEVLFPHNRRVHPFVKSWYDRGSRYLAPLSLVCKSIQREVKDFFYDKAVFTSPVSQCHTKLLDCLGYSGQIHPEYESPVGTMVRHLRIDEAMKLGEGHLFFIVRSMKLQSLELGFSEGDARRINKSFQQLTSDERNRKIKGTQCASIEEIRIISPKGAKITEACCEWWSQGLRQNLLYPRPLVHNSGLSGGSLGTDISWLTAERNPWDY